jgi:hypothetical protein
MDACLVGIRIASLLSSDGENLQEGLEPRAQQCFHTHTTKKRKRKTLRKRKPTYLSTYTLHSPTVKVVAREKHWCLTFA